MIENILASSAAYPSRGRGIVVAVALVAGSFLPVACSSTTSSSPDSTPQPSTAVVTPAAVGPKSKMLPEIALPAGSTGSSELNELGGEEWWTDTPYDQSVLMIKAQLPLEQTLGGLPWCTGFTGNEVPGTITTWQWATDTEVLTTSVMSPTTGLTRDGKTAIEFRREAAPTGDGRRDCTAPLPATTSP